MTESKSMSKYFKEIGEKVKSAHKIANTARQKGFDPEERVDIPLAENMAERVEGLISGVAPQLVGTRMTERIQEYEKKYALLDWRVGFKIAEDVVNQEFCKFKDKIEAMEVGIRVGFTYLTGGIVSAPLEGFVGLKVKKRLDGKEYLSAWYAGPVRGAGGTAAATSVVLTDYIRQKMGYSPYDPTENEVKRYVTEILTYHERITNLQYLPKEEEIKFLVKNVPIEISGEPTEEMEVFNYKDLPRVETNRIRGGLCLVIAEGLAQKAPKIWKRLSVWGKDFGLGWSFLEQFLELQKKIKSKDIFDKTGSKEKIGPNYTYIADLVAGRPVLSHPLKEGGFRLRYGRTRISGFSAASIHPATMIILNKYIATGTQLKLERPGKATAVTPCDSIEGPLVKLKDGSVVRIETESQATALSDKISEILFLGDILINYGDFSENGHMLVPPGYNEEWFIQELEKATVSIFGNLDLDKLSELVEIPKEKLNILIKNQFNSKISARAAIALSEKLKIPLHPIYTYHWKAISVEEMLFFLSWLEKMRVETKEGTIQKIILPKEEEFSRILGVLGIPHIVSANEFVVLDKNISLALLVSLGLTTKEDISLVKNKIAENRDKNVFEIINSLSRVKIRDKSGIFIGARMGRPEKAKMRKMVGRPHSLFPVGKEGGRLRAFQTALEGGKVIADFRVFFCEKCGKETIYPVCEVCGKKTNKMYFCNVCGLLNTEKCPKHGETSSFRKREININHYFNSAIKKLKSKVHPDLIKGVRGTSNKDRLSENLIKGILRAKHDIYVNKDGTTRYDMTELPITHFKPKEIKLNVEKMKELGYEADIRGKPLTNSDQILEIKPQDLILAGCVEALDETAASVLFKTANFIDELLVSFYGLKPFYNLKTKEDLVGHFVIGLAPHISAGTVGRIIGFSETQACFAHPLWHASLRRDCDGDECCVMLLMDAFLNFSRQFLPDKRGGRTMDAPLVLTSKIVPAEVDDMVHGLDVVWKYPLEFYEAAINYDLPWDIDIEQIKNRLNTELQYEQIGFTHQIDNINKGITCSAYKTLPSMKDKLKGQMELADKIRAVDEADVAGLVIDKHFLKDTKGNLRKFSQQQFRCVNCNEKFRRTPLIGKCTGCGGKIIFTVSQGSVTKYLEPSISLANKYNLPGYAKQTLELTKRRIEGVFGKEKETQVVLGSWFN